MIGYVRGKVTYLFHDNCFIDVCGVGYRVFISNSTRQQLTIGTETTLFTHLNVRDDALVLFGFSTQVEYELFLQLNSVSGIGPKVALGILSATSPSDFAVAVRQKNATLLTKIPGIGKKTAERIILELKDKIGCETCGDIESPTKEMASHEDDKVTEAVQALSSLGYNAAEIIPVIQKLANSSKSVEQLIKQALKEFGGR